ncbi:MAG: DUF2071 domain containing protein [Flavobacteriaceae bacterium FS1-H7996/R]|nr:MAG: DUF2071 domain containing protein [Flavobacteriaceae bacterium FS1-H7996/R]
MAIWIITGYKKRPNTIAQIILVISMNILEFIMAQELLLWGRLNLLFASLFAFIVYYNQFILKKNQQQYALPTLKNHPFAVEAFFESSLVLTFAVPKEQLQSLIPECLELDTFKDKYAFLAIAMVKTKKLRPKGLPEFMGNDFFLIGYRIFVRYTTLKGKRLRGLYIIKSETDKRKMAFMGNIFTHYDYTTTDINQTIKNDVNEIVSIDSNFKIEINNAEIEIINLPKNSPFENWKEARRFAGPLPFTFTYNKENKEVLIIEGVRKNWKPMPVKVIDYDIAFLKSLKLKNVVLANAFIIKNIPYYWKKGKKELWK